MTNKERHIEIAAISAIISDVIFKKAYELFNNGNMGGYVYTAYELADWAVEFDKMHRKTNWEEILENGYKKMSEHFTQNVICWDDAIMDFAHYKYEQAFSKINSL
ncbi:MAG: hypothetical protein KA007_00230 [Candidatus Pacebacteria bacterium]|nr:hypothetical protein [Candidatus Paceibacterota bacterium]